MKPISDNLGKNKQISFEQNHSHSHCPTECGNIAAAVIRSYNRIIDTTRKHSFKTTLSNNNIAMLSLRLQKILPNFNFKFSNDLAQECPKKLFDELLDHITTLQVPSMELLKTLHTMEEHLHGSDHLKKVETALFLSGILN